MPHPAGPRSVLPGARSRRGWSCALSISPSSSFLPPSSGVTPRKGNPLRRGVRVLPKPDLPLREASSLQVSLRRGIWGQTADARGSSRTPAPRTSGVGTEQGPGAPAPAVARLSLPHQRDLSLVTGTSSVTAQGHRRTRQRLGNGSSPAASPAGTPPAPARARSSLGDLGALCFSA